MAALGLSCAGCANPFSSTTGNDVLRRRVAGAIERELAEVPHGQQRIETTQPPSGNRGAPRHRWIALAETDHEIGSIWFYDVLLGRYHQCERKVHVG